MKTVIISYIVLAIVIISVICNSIFISHSIGKVIAALEDTPAEADEKEAYEVIYKDYMERQKYFSFTVSHDDLTNIEREFAEILGAIDAEDEETLIIAKSRLISALNHLKRLSGINSDSIF